MNKLFHINYDFQKIYRLNTFTFFHHRMCRAQNEIGLQENPCIFHLMPAGKPDPVSNCSVSNQSYSTMSVTCKPGFNGGLRQVQLASNSG